jgi:hypothetical protein
LWSRGVQNGNEINSASNKKEAQEIPSGELNTPKGKRSFGLNQTLEKDKLGQKRI